MRLKGLIAATFTPMDKAGNIDVTVIPAMVDQLISNDISGIYICGSTGEGHSLTIEERKKLAEHFVKAANGRIKTIVNVGHNCLEDARELTKHSSHIGADAISAAPPTYYKITSTTHLVRILTEIAEVAPDLPFYYYHIPAMTGVDLNMVDFLDVAENHIPSLQGIKFTSSRINEFQHCRDAGNGKYQILYGFDEMLLSGLAVGADCMIGSTFNFMPSLYHKILENFRNNQLEKAKQLQLESVKVIDAFAKYSSLPAQKAIMKMVGMDCGSVRLPLIDLSAAEEENLKKDLLDTGLFKWKLQTTADKDPVK